MTKWAKILLYFVIFLLIVAILFFVVLFVIQNVIIIAQEIDYYLYKSSNSSVMYIAQLEGKNNLQATALNINKKGAGNEVYDTDMTQNVVHNVVGPNISQQNADFVQITTFNEVQKTDQKQDSQKQAAKDSTATLVAKSAQTKSTSKTGSSSNTITTVKKDYWITIPKIGVNTEILRYGTLQKRMYKGVAIDVKFGRPNKNEPGKPTILVSHRFGYVWWTPSYRRTNSFYNIDKLKPGDKIFIYWQGKLYKYKITKTEISSVITDYNQDLILYSCVSYFNPKRIIVSAKKIQ